MTPEEELRKLRRLKELESRAALEAPEEKSALQQLVDFGKNVGTALYKGPASMATMAADAAAGSYDHTDAATALVNSLLGGDNPKPRKLDQSFPTTRALASTGYQPQGRGEKILNTTIQGATSALLPGGIFSVPKALTTGAVSGMASETVGGMKGISDTPAEPYARVAAGLLGGIGTGMMLNRTGNANDLAREALAGVTPEQIENAHRVMVQSQVAKLPLNADQAMGTDTNLKNLVAVLAKKTEGQPLIDQLRAQPDLARVLANRLVSELPGQARSPQEIANAGQEIATEAIKAARRTRTLAVEPYYKAAGELPEELVRDLYTAVKQAAKEAPNTNKGNLFDQLAKVMVAGTKPRVQERTQVPGIVGDFKAKKSTPGGEKLLTNADELNAAFRSLVTNQKNPNLSATAGDREAVGALKDMIKSAREKMGEASPNFQKGNELYAKISREQVDPLTQSVVGRVAGAAGATADKEAVNKLLPVIAAGRDPATARNTSEILKMAEISRNRPEVMTDAVKTHISQAIAAAEKQVAGQQSSNFAGTLEKILVGDSRKQTGLKDALQAVADLNGMPPNDIYKGMMAGLKLIGASARRPSSIGPEAAQLEEMARQSTVAGGLKMVGLAPGKPAARALERAYSANAYRTLAENLTSPEGLKKIQELGRVPLVSKKAQTLIQALTATAATTEPESAEQVE